MKHEIIKTDNYLLVVDESEIKGWYYDAYINKVKHSGGAEYGESIITRNIIAHLPLNGSPILEGVDLLPPLEDKIDVEKMAHAAAGYPKHEGDREKFYIKGYTQALEDNKDKKYTEEDLRKAMFLYGAWILGGTPSLRIAETAEERQEQIIQSLSQPKMPIGFECELVNIMGKGEPITERNSQGHTQWVGTYIYE